MSIYENLLEIYNTIRFKFIKYIWKTLDPYGKGKITFGQLLDRSPIKIWHILLIGLYFLSIYRIMQFDGTETAILSAA